MDTYRYWILSDKGYCMIVSKKHSFIEELTLFLYDTVKNKKRLVRRSIFMMYPIWLIINVLFLDDSNVPMYSFSFFLSYRTFFISYFITLLLALIFSCFSSSAQKTLYLYSMLSIVCISCFVALTSLGANLLIFLFAWHDIILNSFRE